MKDKEVARAPQVGAPPALTFREKMFAGAIARGVSQTILHPVDVVRTRMQARSVKTSWKPGVFIKGVIPQISLAIPAGAVQFLAFEAAKEKLAKWFPDEKTTQARLLIAGAFGALAAASFRVPQEVLKQRVQADIFPNVFVALKETLRVQGFGGLYNGALATISRDVPWNALSFMFHGQGKAIFKASTGRVPENDENLAIAGIAGAVAAVIMTPVDVVKTRIMTAQTGIAPSGIVRTLRNIITEEGAGTLMKGVVPRVIFLAPLAGITFSVYEAVAAKIRKSKEDKNSEARATPGRDKNAAPHPYRRLATFAMRFAKSPVRLARADSPGAFLGDYYTASARISFSPAC